MKVENLTGLTENEKNRIINLANNNGTNFRKKTIPLLTGQFFVNKIFIWLEAEVLSLYGQTGTSSPLYQFY